MWTIREWLAAGRTDDRHSGVTYPTRPTVSFTPKALELRVQLVARSIEWGSDIVQACRQGRTCPSRSIKGLASSQALCNQLYHSPASAEQLPLADFGCPAGVRKTYNDGGIAQLLMRPARPISIDPTRTFFQNSMTALFC
jgi:hypothetical protein